MYATHHHFPHTNSRFWAREALYGLGDNVVTTLYESPSYGETDVLLRVKPTNLRVATYRLVDFELYKATTVSSAETVSS